MIAKLSLPILVADHDYLRGHCPYLLGAKWPFGWTKEQARGHKNDCSGYASWALSRAGVQLQPMGSQEFIDWADGHGLHRLAHYSDVQYAAQDASRVFLAVLSPPGGQAWPRHVWMVSAGRTLECCGSLGVGSRPWDVHILKPAQHCWELPA